MKKKLIFIGICFALSFSFLLTIGVISLIAGAGQVEETIELSAAGWSEEVEQYRSKVLKYAEKKEIENYVNHLLCLMQEETAGLGTDVMNAGAFISNTKYERNRGSILDPNYSIECGVTEFAELLKLVQVSDTNDTQKLLIVYQAYHTDRNYIEYALKNGGYTPENAKAYQSANGYPDYVDCYFAEHISFWFNSINYTNGFIHPLETTYMSSPFGYRQGKFEGFHGGCDFPAPTGTPVYASADGIVTLSGIYGTGGNCIIIKHSETHSTLYAHNSKLNVSEGTYVKQGDIIAFVGSTGLSSGPHCHFEMWIDGEKVDPIPYLSGTINDIKLIN